MRILAISDVASWNGYTRILDKVHPDLVVLAGDLTSDGFARFWNDALECVPRFVAARKRLMSKLGVRLRDGLYVVPHSVHEEFSDGLYRLKDRYRDTEEFESARNRIHIGRFYRFLSVAGTRAPVLVVMGDHDEDFEGDYLVERINQIPGCQEISGRSATITGMRFLGLGYKETHYRRRLRPLIAQHSGSIDVVVAHAEQSAMPLIAEVRPKLIVRGHFGAGCYRVNGVPSVFTSVSTYTVIELGKAGTPEIHQYSGKLDSKNWQSTVRESNVSHCAPWFSSRSEFEMYSWLQPYRDPSG